MNYMKRDNRSRQDHIVPLRVEMIAIDQTGNVGSFLLYDYFFPGNKRRIVGWSSNSKIIRFDFYKFLGDDGAQRIGWY